MIAGGINAVVIGARHPVSADTDSLFTAFAIYSIWLVVAASMRTALVSRLVDREERFAPFNTALASLVWLTPLVIIVQLGFGIPVLSAASSGDGRIGVEALLIFCPAAILQLAIAVAASMFAVLDEFAAQAWAFMLGGLVNVVAFLLLEPSLGLVALPIAALISSTATALLLIAGLRRRGWTLAGCHLAPIAGSWAWLKLMGVGSAYALGGQAIYLISMLFATTALPAGNATVYTYAYMAIGLVVALSASSGAMALAAPVAESWRGNAAELIPVEDDVTRAMATMLVAVAGVVAILGASLAAPLLPGFTAADIQKLVESATILSIFAIGSGVTIVPLVAMYAAQRYGQIALVTATSLPVVAMLITLFLRLDESVTSIALGASLAVLLLGWGILWLAHRGATPKRIFAQLSQIALVAVPGALAYGSAHRLLADQATAGVLEHLLAAIVGSAVFGVYIALALPGYRELLTRMFMQLLGRPRTA